MEEDIKIIKKDVENIKHDIRILTETIFDLKRIVIETQKETAEGLPPVSIEALKNEDGTPYVPYSKRIK